MHPPRELANGQAPVQLQLVEHPPVCVVQFHGDPCGDEHRRAAPAPHLAEAVEASLTSGLAHFAPPGHKRSARFGELLGADITLLAGVEDQSLSLGLLERAERDVADAWRAGWARISVQGSSHVNHAVGLALGAGADAPGGHVIVARHAHKSVLAGLVLSGLTPAWVMHELDAGGLVAGIPVARVAARLRELPDARAVVLVEPSYTGSVSDLESTPPRPLCGGCR